MPAGLRTDAPGRARTTLLVLSVIIAVDLWFWCISSPRHLPFLGVCCVSVAQAGRTYHPVLAKAIVVREGAALRVVEVYSAEAKRAQTAPRPGESVLADLFCVPYERTAGLLAPVVETRDHTMHIVPRAAPLSAGEHAAVRTLFAAFLTGGAGDAPGGAWYRGGPWAAPYAAMLAQGDGRTSVLRWPGLLHDIAALPALAAWLWLVPKALDVQGRRRRRREASLAGGRCPRCGYNVAALLRHDTPRCPECAEPLR